MNICGVYVQYQLLIIIYRTKVKALLNIKKNNTSDISKC